VLVDDFPPVRRGSGAAPRIGDAELIALAIARVLLGLRSDRRFLALARYRLGRLFRCLPKRPGYNKRLRRLVPQIAGSIGYPAFGSPSCCDGIRPLDSTPVPRGQSRDRQPLRVRRSRRPRHCRSHWRCFRGLRPYLVHARDGTPIGFEPAPRPTPPSASRPSSRSSGCRPPATC
jgi:hypothetical protein